MSVKENFVEQLNNAYKDACKALSDELVSLLSGDDLEQQIAQIIEEVDVKKVFGDQAQLLANIVEYTADAATSASVLKVNVEDKQLKPWFQPHTPRKLLVEKLVVTDSPTIKPIAVDDDGWLSTSDMVKHLGYKSDGALHNLFNQNKLDKKFVFNGKQKHCLWRVLKQTEAMSVESTPPTPNKRKPGTPPSDPRSLKPETRQNLQKVTRCLAGYPELTRGEICKKTGLKSKKVAYVLDYAKGRKLVKVSTNKKWSLTDFGLDRVKVVFNG